MPQTNDDASLIVGASRGLGLGLAKELLGRGRRVIGTVRRPGQRTGLHAFAEAAGGRLEIEQADITAPDQLRALRERLAGRTLDLLFVNAGTAEREVADFAQAFHQVMTTNVLGAMDAVRVLSDLVRPGGAVAAMSSGLGSVADNTAGGWEPYRSSKAALNQSLRSFAAETPDRPWSVTAVAPGWVRTDMGGEEAPLDVETSCRGVVDMLQTRMGPRDCAFRDYQGTTVPW
jgi:NAD(P)-dependent dehydrogenase (short-subunit alcohol dehydrogenase family)